MYFRERTSHPLITSITFLIGTFSCRWTQLVRLLLFSAFSKRKYCINPIFLCIVCLLGSCWLSLSSSVFWLWPSSERRCTRMSRPCSSVILYSRAATKLAMTKPSPFPTSATGSSRSYWCAHPASALSPTLSISQPSRETGATLFSIQ